MRWSEVYLIDETKKKKEGKSPVTLSKQLSFIGLLSRYKGMQ